MRIYLAARYSRYPEMEALADRLRHMGHTVTSRWHAGAHQVPDDCLDPLAHPDSVKFATEDVADLIRAQIVISFTEGSRVSSRGGRHVEFGMALGLSKRLWLVGQRENVFHCLPRVQQFDNVVEMIRHLDTYFSSSSIEAEVFSPVY